MTIPAVRFGSLDQEFNVPVTSISLSDPAQILNSASNDISNLTGDILSAVTSISKSLNLAHDLNVIVGLKNRVENALGITKLLGSIISAERAVRTVRGIMKSTLDADKLFGKNIDSILNKVFHTDPVVQNTMRALNVSQNNKLVGNVTVGRPFRPVCKLPTGSPPPPGTSLPVAIGSTDYNYTQIVQAIGKLSGTGYAPVPVDKNALVQQMVILGNLAYEANLTGVMKSLSSIPNATPDVIARATSIIMVEQSTKGNIAAIMDMTTGTNSIVTSDNAPIHQAPSVLADTFVNFQAPVGTTDQNLASLATTVISTAAAIDANWNVSDYDGTPSTKYFPAVTQDLSNAMKAKVVNNIFDESNLNISFNNPDQDLYCAIAANDPTANLAINKIIASQGNCCIRPSSMCC